MFEKELDELGLNELIKKIETLDRRPNSGAPLRVAFLSNFTIEPIMPYLKYLCYGENFRLVPHIGDYNNILQFAVDRNNYTGNSDFDLIIIAVKLENFSERLTAEFSSLNPSEISEESGKVISFIGKVLGEIRKNAMTPVLVHNFETPVYPSLGILDFQGHHSQLNVIRRLNSDIIDLAGSDKGIFIVDVALLQATIGHMNFIDNRFWNIAKAPYTKEAYKLLAREYVKFIRALKGKNKKCLVLDCDDTLWGGIVGEDGVNKIKIGITYPGAAYREFQQAVLNLHRRGVLLAICSKNNKADILEVLNTHPDMVLRKEHFVSMKIDWNDKVTNLREISRELNIGLDSMVFIDDNEFEVNLVKALLPDVEAIKLPDDPSLYKEILNSCGLFDTLTISEEDKKRNEMYRAEGRRKQAREEFRSATLEDYYKYLEMEISIDRANEFSASRISQLTQRTNQFNLTTKRYHELEIKEMANADGFDVLSLHLKDRFGNSGLVGAAILRYSEREAFLDTFLLSCRVIGRGVEDALLNVCIDKAVRRHYETIIGQYICTRKNAQVEGFYKFRNFLLVKENEDGAIYSLSLKENKNRMPGYFKSIKVDNEDFRHAVVVWGDNRLWKD